MRRSYSSGLTIPAFASSRLPISSELRGGDAPCMLVTSLFARLTVPGVRPSGAPECELGRDAQGSGKRMAVLRRRSAFLAIAAVVAVAALPGTAEPVPSPLVHIWTIHYRAHDGRVRRAFVELPAWYGPQRHPSIPMIISPHGRGMSAQANLRVWGELPALGRLAVVDPEGQGRRLALFAWGDPGDVSDLSKMPDFAERALPWLHIDRGRIYAFGGSMGGQETLLLVAKDPHLLAGAAAFDAPTNMAARYQAFPLLHGGYALQRLARIEIGGTPATDARGYAIRSPLGDARRIAFSGVPLQIWWSIRDRIVVEQAQESGRLYRTIKRLNPDAPVQEFVGAWAHTAEMRPDTRLPTALKLFHLLPR
jgi:poly(3-hydroxybutyrate) depolymerase